MYHTGQLLRNLQWGKWCYYRWSWINVLNRVRWPFPGPNHTFRTTLWLVLTWKSFRSLQNTISVNILLWCFHIKLWKSRLLLNSGLEIILQTNLASWYWRTWSYTFLMYHWIGLWYWLYFLQWLMGPQMPPNGIRWETSFANVYCLHLGQKNDLTKFEDD